MISKSLVCSFLVVNNVFCKWAQIFQFIRVVMYTETALSLEGMKEIDCMILGRAAIEKTLEPTCD